jgi:hypothetical protein
MEAMDQRARECESDTALLEAIGDLDESDEGDDDDDDGPEMEEDVVEVVVFVVLFVFEMTGREVAISTDESDSDIDASDS